MVVSNVNINVPINSLVFGTTVNGLAELSQVNTSYKVVWVNSLLDMFTLVPENNLEPDGITIIEAKDGGRWVRQGLTNEYWWNFPEWYIDSENGNDENAGDSTEAPLKTASEINRRLNNAILKQQTKIYILNDIDDLSFNFSVSRDTVFDPDVPIALRVLGHPSAWATIYSGVIGSVLPINRGEGGGNALQLTVSDPEFDWDTSGPDESSLIAYRIRITSGDNAGAVGFAVKRLSANEARCTTFIIYDPETTLPNPFQTVKFITPQVGESFVVERLPGVKSIKINNTSALLRLPGNATLVDSVEAGKGLPDFTSSHIILQSDTWFTTLCRSRVFSRDIDIALWSLGNLVIGDARHRVGTISGGGVISTSAVVLDGHIRSMSVQDDWIVQGGRFFPFGFWRVGPSADQGNFSIVRGVGVFDSVSAAVEVRPSDKATVHRGIIYGNGNADVGIEIDKNAAYIYSGDDTKPTITGNNGDCKLGSDTGVILSWDEIPNGPNTLTRVVEVTVPEIPANSTATQDITVTGARVGNGATITTEVDLPQGVAIVGAKVVSSNTVRIRYINTTGDAITPDAQNMLIHLAWQGAAGILREIPL